MTKTICAAAAALLLTAMRAPAHHAFAAEYDENKLVTVSGTVTGFKWTNPHAWIRMEVMDAKGQPKEWAVEMGSLTILVQLGWNPKTLQAGDKIKISLHPMKSGLPGGDFMTLDDGGHNMVKNDGGAQERQKTRAAHRAAGNT